MGRIGSTKLVLPKWHKYGTYNRHFRVAFVIIIALRLNKNLMKGNKLENENATPEIISSHCNHSFINLTIELFEIVLLRS